MEIEGDEVLNWRSLLYVPAHVKRYLEKATELNADAIVLDLEDSVPIAQKKAARDAAQAFLRVPPTFGSSIAVRINRLVTLAGADLEAVVWPALSTIVIPKVEAPEHVRLISEAVANLELRRGMEPGSIALVALIETPRALLSAFEIASADKRIKGVALGAEDLAAYVGMVPDPDSMQVPAALLLLAARAAGCSAFGLADSFADFRDMDRFRASLERARKLGFDGTACIHPDQVEEVNRCFDPPVAEVEHAQRIVRSYQIAEEKGLGSVGLDGLMVDLPVVRRAEKLLRRAHANSRPPLDQSS